MTLKAKIVRSSVSADLKTLYFKGTTGVQSVNNTEGYQGITPYDTNLSRASVYVKLLAFVKLSSGLVNIPFNTYNEADFDNPVAVSTVYASLPITIDSELEIYTIPIIKATVLSTENIAVDDLYYDTDDGLIYRVTALNDYSARTQVTDPLLLVSLSDFGSVYHDIALYLACEALKVLTFDHFFAVKCVDKDDRLKAVELLEEQINNASLAHLAKLYDTAISIIEMINGIVRINCC